jgi:hypothetical protein
VYALDRDTDVCSEVFRAFVGRSVWILDGPSVSGRGFEVVAGPLSTEAALAVVGR